MVAERVAQQQIKRLAVYGDYERLRDAKVLPELRRALMHSGGTDERAVRVMDRILADADREFCPKPGQIQAAARNTADYPESRGYGCAKCQDPDNLAPAGFIRVSLYGEGTVRLCDCRKARTA